MHKNFVMFKFSLVEPAMKIKCGSYFVHNVAHVYCRHSYEKKEE